MVTYIQVRMRSACSADHIATCSFLVEGCFRCVAGKSRSVPCDCASLNEDGSCRGGLNVT